MTTQALQIAKAAGAIEKDGYLHVLQGDYTIKRFYEMVREEALREAMEVVQACITDQQKAGTKLTLILAAKQIELRMNLP